jgi:hypothetical protein
VAEPARDEVADELAALPIDPDLGPGEAIFPTQQSGVTAPGVALFAADRRRRPRLRRRVLSVFRTVEEDAVESQGNSSRKTCRTSTVRQCKNRPFIVSGLPGRPVSPVSTASSSRPAAADGTLA